MVKIEVSLDGSETIAPAFNWTSLQYLDPAYNSTSPTAVLLIALSFWAFVISVPGLAWHIKNRNLSAASMVGWIVYLNLVNIINALIWHNDNITTWWDGEVYCDIVIKLDIAGGVGLVGSLACIMRSLAQALDTNNIRLMPSQGQRIRKHILEIFLCVGLPLTIALLHFAIQPMRYYVLAIAGCEASIKSVWYALLLNTIWPPILCLLAAYYAILLVIRVYRYRRDFSSVLANSSGSINKSRFIRLFVSALTVLLVAIPTQGYALYVNAINGMDDSWIPASWQTIVYVPTYGIVFADCWIHVGIAVPVFLCFGWGKDANSVYRSWLRILGLTKLFPALDQPDNELKNTAANSKKNTSSNGSSTLNVFSKMSKLFEFNKTDASGNTSLLPSMISRRRSVPTLSNVEDMEKQDSDAGVPEKDMAHIASSSSSSPTAAAAASHEVSRAEQHDGQNEEQV